MIIRQTTTIVFEYPQDYLQEQEWCKTKGERWIHKSTDTLGAVYENTISYSIGQPNSSEKPNNCEPKICDTCRYYNSNIPCGSTPSACKKADKFAEEFVDGLKKLTYVINPQEPTNDDKCFECDDFFTCGGQCNKIEDEPQTNADQHVQHVESVEPMQTEREGE